MTSRPWPISTDSQITTFNSAVGVDQTSSEVFQKLTELRNEGIALLIVEQNVRLALEYVNRGYLLVNGEVREKGTAAHLSSPHLMKSAFLL